MLGASAHRLYRAPHVAALRQQIPPRRHEAIGVDSSPLVGSLEGPAHRVIKNDRPDGVAVAPNHRVRRAEFLRLPRIERRVDAAEHDDSATGPCCGANLVASKGIACMDPNPDYVTWLDAIQIQWLERFIRNLRAAIRRWCRGCEHEKPARSDDADAEREMARVHQVYGHIQSLFIGPHYCRLGVDEATLEESTVNTGARSGWPPTLATELCAGLQARNALNGWDEGLECRELGQDAGEQSMDQETGQRKSGTHPPRKQLEDALEGSVYW